MEKHYRLPKEFTEEWLKELRSGKHLQCTGQLTVNGAYCCLGVAGKMRGLSDEDMSISTFVYALDSSSIEDSCTDQIEAQLLTTKAIEVGYPKELLYDGDDNNINDTEDPAYGLRPLTTVLSSLNDIDCLTFPEIADWIERHVELYDEPKEIENEN